MREEPKIAQLYRHFKGTVYRIISLAEHTETGERMVVYTGNDSEGKTYVRPLDMFMSEVDKEKYPDVKEKYRFTLVGGEEEVDEDDEDYDNAQLNLDPLLEAFLDANSFEDKLNQFYLMRNKADADMLSTVAMSLDFELSKEDVDEQYIEILNCLRTMAKYECNRLRP